MGVTAERLGRWRAQCLRVAASVLDGRVAPLSSAQVDQVLAAARDAGLSEREQGALILSIVETELDKRNWGNTSRAKQRAFATAITVQIMP